RTSTSLFAASTSAAYNGAGATRYASVIQRRSAALAASSCTVRYTRARPGTPSTGRTVEPPAVGGSASSSSGGRAGPARLQMRANAPSNAAAAGRVVADDVILEMDPTLRRPNPGQHRVQGTWAVGVVLEAVAADWPRAGSAVDGQRQLAALGRWGRRPRVGARNRGGAAHATGACAPRPSAPSTGRSAWITKAMCSSNGTPSSVAP